MPEWITAIIGLAGVVIGVGITEFRRWMERKERYKEMVFEKRLNVHQEAYYLCCKLMIALHLLKVVEKKNNTDCVKAVARIHDWWPHKCLYLDNHSQGLILEVLRLSTHQVDNIMEGKIDEVLDVHIDRMFNKTLECIARGIGVKYLPDIREQIGLQ